MRSVYEWGGLSDGLMAPSQYHCLEVNVRLGTIVKKIKDSPLSIEQKPVFLCLAPWCSISDIWGAGYKRILSLWEELERISCLTRDVCCRTDVCWVYNGEVVCVLWIWYSQWKCHVLLSPSLSCGLSPSSSVLSLLFGAMVWQVELKCFCKWNCMEKEAHYIK